MNQQQRGPRLITAIIGTVFMMLFASSLRQSSRVALGRNFNPSNSRVAAAFAAVADANGGTSASTSSSSSSSASSRSISGTSSSTSSSSSGFTPQHFLNYFANSMMKTESKQQRRGKKGPDQSTISLARALGGRKRALCEQRYPNGLTITDEQDDFIRHQSYFVILTLRNNEDLLHHTLYELLELILRVGPKNVFVSVFENNSKDKTPAFLSFFTSMLKLAGVEHHLVSTWTISEAAASLAAASAAGGGAGVNGSDINLLDLISMEDKWTGNRIEFLAKVRNLSLRPLFAQSKKYEKVVILNDAYVCAEDILRLILHKDAEVSCGLDFDTTNNYGVGFYDTWVDRDVHGEDFTKTAPFFKRASDVEKLNQGVPIPVFCCWNGVLVADAKPFYDGVRFRRGRPGECAASECSLFCKDAWMSGLSKFSIDPHVRLAYDLPTYHALHNVDWVREGPSGSYGRVSTWDLKGNGERVAGGSKVPGTNRSEVLWPEEIPWPPHGPNRVWCCGLEGNGRSPDQQCVREQLNLPLKMRVTNIDRIKDKVIKKE